MSEDLIPKISSIDVYSVKNVLSASNLTDTQKAQFIRNNRSDIKSLMATKMNSAEYNMLIANRPLLSFRPVVNSFTKRGDKVLLAKTLGIQTSEVNDAINNTSSVLGTNAQNKIPKDDISAMRTYVYRHGTQAQLVSFFNHELTQSGNIEQTLLKEFEYTPKTLAGYFSRPIHRMTDKTFVQLYNIVDANILRAKNSGQIGDVKANQLSEWALAQIYQIQQNSKFINAIKKGK